MKKQCSRVILAIVLMLALFPLVLLAGCKSDEKYGVTKDKVHYRYNQQEISTERVYRIWSELAPELAVEENGKYYLRYWYVSGLSKGFLDMGAEPDHPVIRSEIRGIPVASVNCELGKPGKTVTLPDSIRFINKALYGTVNTPANLLYLSALATNHVENLELEGGLYYWGNWQVDYASSKIGSTVEVREGTVGIADLPGFDSLDHGETLVIPDSVRCIGEGCFSNTASRCYPALDLPGVEYVGWKAFEGDGTRISSVTFSEKLRYIGGYAFSGSRVEHVDVSQTDGCAWGEGVFYNTKKLVSVQLPDGMNTITSNMFQDSAIASLNLPDSITSIGWCAFQGCRNLTSVRLPENLKTLGYQAFAGTGITEITVPGGVSEIPKQCFQLCTSLGRVTLSEGVTVIKEEAFDSCSGLYSVTLPDSLTRIEANAFDDVRDLTVTIPENVTYLGSYAFTKTADIRFADTEGWKAGGTRLSPEELASDAGSLYRDLRNKVWEKEQ